MGLRNILLPERDNPPRQIAAPVYSEAIDKIGEADTFEPTPTGPTKFVNLNSSKIEGVRRGDNGVEPLNVAVKQPVRAHGKMQAVQVSDDGDPFRIVYTSRKGETLTCAALGHVLPVPCALERLFRGDGRTPFGESGAFFTGLRAPGTTQNLVKHVAFGRGGFVSMTASEDMSLDYAADRIDANGGLAFQYVIDNSLVKGIDVNATYRDFGTDEWAPYLEPEEREYWASFDITRAFEHEVVALTHIDGAEILGAYPISSQPRSGFERRLFDGEHGPTVVYVGPFVANPNHNARPEVLSAPVLPPSWMVTQDGPKFQHN